MSEDITIIIEPGESGWWVATIPEISGAVSQGKTEAEAREMVLDCMHELMAFRREEALREKGADAKVERLKLAG